MVFVVALASARPRFCWSRSHIYWACAARQSAF